jgi:hypothetical protein
VLPPLALRVGRKRPAAIRPLGPLNSQPAQIFNHRLNEFSATPLWIQIFISENQLSAMLDSTLRRNPERARVPKVQQPGR